MSKTIWPHNLFETIDEMKKMKKFPPRRDFESELRGKSLPPLEDYIAAKREFYRRSLLPKTSPEKIKSMFDWLRHYNIVDVQFSFKYFDCVLK